VYYFYCVPGWNETTLNTEASLEEVAIILSHFEGIQSFTEANKFLMENVNITDFFTTSQHYAKFLEFLLSYKKPNQTTNREWGDVQTPTDFVNEVYKIITATNFTPDIIIEPTCGIGNFLKGALNFFPKAKLLYGVEIQEKHLWYFLLDTLSRVLIHNIHKQQSEIKLFSSDIFSHIFPQELRNDPKKSILVIGNPPWVTASELSKMNSQNIPVKSNIKKFSGIEAITGKSNFDISENIIVKMIENFSEHQGKLAILCKTSVIRNILKSLPDKNWKIGNIQALQFSAKKVFGKTCDASLLLMNFNVKEKSPMCSLSNLENPDKIIRNFGWVEDKFVADIQKYHKIKRLDKTGKYTWRHGVKHDASKILELEKLTTNTYKNKIGEELSIEDDLVYPLLKGSNLRNFEPKDKMKRILITQKALNEDTNKIKQLYPKTWHYLTSKEEYFHKRKSRIYKNKHEFSIFGIGNYSFTSYKVAIAGLYKTPFFAVIKPIMDKPVIFDDTCYYLSFNSFNEALFIASALNSNSAREFFDSIVFQDAKRPFTKEVLMRLDINQIINEMTFTDLEGIWKDLYYSNPDKIKSSNFKEYKRKRHL